MPKDLKSLYNCRTWHPQSQVSRGLQATRPEAKIQGRIEFGAEGKYQQLPDW